LASERNTTVAGKDARSLYSRTVTFTVSNTKDAYISFTNKETGKKFKLFARELSEQGKELREFQTKQAELLKKDLENESTNKEA
jgi:hypothetical protein